MNRKLLPFALSSSLFFSGLALAAPQDVAGAELLFEEGRTLMEAGKLDEACPKLAESQRLAPAAGTLLNLGLCYEKAGKTASAWGSYREAIAISSSTNQKEREEYARELTAAIEPKLVRLTVQAKPGMEVRRDGIAMTSAQWGTAIPVDPGKHVLEATAPGKKPYRHELDVTATMKFAIPALEDAPPEPTSSDVTITEGSKTLKVVGIGAMGLGVVLGGVGAIFGLSANSKSSELEDQAGARTFTWSGTQNDTYDSGQSAATLANVFLISGAVALATGVVITYFGFRKTETRKASAPAPSWGVF